MARRFLFFVVLFEIATVNLSAQERLRLIHAGTLRRHDIGGEIVQELVGDVKLQQGAMTIECDAAAQFVRRKTYLLTGHVKIDDEEQTLYADSVEVNEATQMQVAKGHVVRVTADDTTRADRMTYYQESEKLLAAGNVRVADTGRRSILTGSVAEFWRERQFGRIWGDPVLTHQDSSGKNVSTVTADTMKIWDEKEMTIAIGNVVIKQSGLTATSGFSEYSKPDEKFTLLQHPSVLQGHQKIDGDTLELRLVDGEIKQADVTGKALAVSDADTLHPGKCENRLSGDRMTFHFDGGQLVRALVESRATSLYHVVEDNVYKGANEISGDRIIIEMVDGGARRILVKSSPDVAEGKYIPPGLN